MSDPTSLTAMTFNIRYDEPADGPRAWPHRRDAVLQTIRAHDPDLLGLQEPTAGQWQEFVAGLPALSAFGLSGAESEDGASHGGFFRTERFAAIDRGVFWLSDTPSTPYSISWPNDWGPRACSWVALDDEAAGEQIVFASTHLDTNAGSWLPSARVLHAQLDAVARGRPVVLAGDFNCAAGSDAHRYLTHEAGFRDAWLEAGNADAGVLTFNGFAPITELPGDPEARRRWIDASTPAGMLAGARDNYRIDWILLRGALVAREARIDSRLRGGVLPSDHYPVVARIDYARQLAGPHVARKPPPQL
jgi:endonuclease/exonuclease/phosphatase family metal-dependent hydrolase